MLVKTEAHYDRYDMAFAAFFKDIETPEGLPEKIWEWLDKELPELQVTDAMRKQHRQLDLDELKRPLEERLAEQTEEHHGGNRWVGTGGTSPLRLWFSSRRYSHRWYGTEPIRGQGSRNEAIPGVQNR